LEAELKKVPGIIEVSASQTSAAVTYNPTLITVDQIRQRFALLGHPVTPQ
jgi:copper chaperone CopZ